MTAAEFINWLTNLVTVLVTSGVVVTVLQKAYSRKAVQQQRADKQKADDRELQRDREEADRRDRERRELLTAAQTEAQRTAITSMHDVNESLRVQCNDCATRLTRTEDRLRHVETALRVVIRVIDQNDPAAIELAITAARELI